MNPHVLPLLRHSDLVQEWHADANLVDSKWSLPRLLSPVSREARGTPWFPTPTFIRVAKSPSEGSPHFDIAVLQVLQQQLVHRDGLAVHLERLPLVAAHRPRQHQDLLEEEHVEFLRGKMSNIPVRELTRPLGVKASLSAVSPS